MNVIVEGRADLYAPYGTFSLNVYAIEPTGEGALSRAYELLKLKLSQEGLFADEHKLPLPIFITKIALITAKNSAAYSDFIKILKEQLGKYTN
jgi:exodeoxyribonuclease VII large subunit